MATTLFSDLGGVDRIFAVLGHLGATLEVGQRLKTLDTHDDMCEARSGLRGGRYQRGGGFQGGQRGILTTTGDDMRCEWIR